LLGDGAVKYWDVDLFRVGDEGTAQVADKLVLHPEVLEKKEKAAELDDL
jgi:hypothetical protein